ncbi:hypothetical protein VNO77_18873 [Canavalia gladiata]|uniref:Uncharacterized protein n=1 Tax=Canavalia gladiata TaxID=3824 RepID=A0AAN9QK10_CANGL
MGCPSFHFKHDVLVALPYTHLIDFIRVLFTQICAPRGGAQLACCPFKIKGFLAMYMRYNKGFLEHSHHTSGSKLTSTDSLLHESLDPSSLPTVD